MSDPKRPGGDAKDWVDPDRTRPTSAFDKSDGSTGQQYSREREEGEGARDPSGNVGRHEGAPPGSAAADEDSFAGTPDPD